MAKQPLTTEQKQTERHHEFAEKYADDDLPEKDPKDGDGPLTVGETSPASNIAKRQEVPLTGVATSNPSEESAVEPEEDVSRRLSPNEVREKAEKDAKKRAQPPSNKGYGRRG